MRFKQLQGLTGLPIDQLRRQFRDADVRTVLPATETEDSGARDSVLVATAGALAVVSREGSSRRSRASTLWAPWDVVRVGNEDDPMTAPDGHRLVVYVGGLRFEARLPGELGRQALQDFVRAAPAQSIAPAP